MEDTAVRISFEDGTEEDYDPEFVKSRILLADREERIDEELALELSEIVALFIKKMGRGEATAEELDQMVFKVFRETGHMRTAVEYARNVDLEGKQISAAFYLDGMKDQDSILDVLDSENSPLEVIALFKQGAYLIFKPTKWKPDDSYVYKMTFERVKKRRHIVHLGIRINPRFVLNDREAQLIDGTGFNSLAEVLESSRVSYYAVARNQRRKEVFLRGYTLSAGVVLGEDVGQNPLAARPLLTYGMDDRGVSY